MKIVKFLDRFRKETIPEVSMNLSGALQSYRNGGPKPVAEKELTDDDWNDIWRRLRPYTKTLAVECANLYTAYVERTGNTTCPEAQISFHMINELWEAYRRAEIKKFYPDAKTLPNLAPYFVDTVRLLNSKESTSNHVAYIRERDKGTNEIAWFVAPIDETKRKPKMAAGKNEIVDKVLS